MWSPGNHAGLGHTDVVDSPSHPEIGDFHSIDTVLKQDVRWFYVSVYQPLSMSGGKARRRLRSDTQNLGYIQRAV